MIPPGICSAQPFLTWVATACAAPSGRPVTLFLTGGEPSALLSATLALALALLHLVAGRLTFLSLIPRSRVLSLAGGVTVAYVFVHVLPELGATHETIAETGMVITRFDEYVYLVTLLGFVTYYGLEQFARRSQSTVDGEETRPGVFWFHVGSFAVYNALIGVLLFHPEAPGVGHLLPFAVALGFHFLVNDYGLREHYEAAYHDRGRWLLAGAILVGAGLGAVVTMDRAILGLMFAFLSGGIVLNVIKEELPAKRESRFVPFLLGSVGYAALLLSL